MLHSVCATLTIAHGHRGTAAHLCKTPARTEPAAGPTDRGQCHCVPVLASPSAPGTGHTLLGEEVTITYWNSWFPGEPLYPFPRHSHLIVFQPQAPWGETTALSNQLIFECEDRISQAAFLKKKKRILWAKRFRETLYTRSPTWRFIMYISILEDMRSPIGNTEIKHRFTQHFPLIRPQNAFFHQPPQRPMLLSVEYSRNPQSWAQTVRFQNWHLLGLCTHWRGICNFVVSFRASKQKALASLTLPRWPRRETNFSEHLSTSVSTCHFCTRFSPAAKETGKTLVTQSQPGSSGDKTARPII